MRISYNRPDNRSTVDSLEKQPDTPIVHCIHGRGRKAVRPTKFWTRPKMDSYKSLRSGEGSEEDFSLSEEETGQLSHQSPVSSPHPKQNLSSLTSSHYSHIATTPQRLPCDPQSTLQVTPRVSRDVIPVLSQFRNGQVHGKFHSPKYLFPSVRSNGAHDAAPSGSEDSRTVAKNTAAATRNDKKLWSILNSTWQASRSPMSSLGSDRGGGQAIPEFSLWKKKWPGKNDVRKQNHKPSSTRLSTIATSFQTAPPALDEGATTLKSSSLSNQSPFSNDHPFSDSSHLSAGETHVQHSKSSSSCSPNPFATHAAPPQNHHVSSLSGEGDGLSSSTPYTLVANSSRSCFATPSPPCSSGVMKLAQNNASICNGGGSSGLNVRMCRDSNIYQETTISHWPSDVSSNSANCHMSSSPNDFRWPWSPLKKDRSVQGLWNSNNTHGQGPRQHQKSEEKRKSRQHLGRSDDVLPRKLDKEGGYHHRNSKSHSGAIGRDSFKYRSCGGAFSSPIMSSSSKSVQGGNNSMMNEAMEIRAPRPIETQWKDHSTVFQGRSNESSQKKIPHRRGASMSRCVHDYRLYSAACEELPITNT